MNEILARYLRKRGKSTKKNAFNRTPPLSEIDFLFVILIGGASSVIYLFIYSLSCFVIHCNVCNKVLRARKNKHHHHQYHCHHHHHHHHNHVNQHHRHRSCRNHYHAEHSLEQFTVLLKLRHTF